MPHLIVYTSFLCSRRSCTQPSPFMLHILAVVSSEQEANQVPLGSHCECTEVCVPGLLIAHKPH